jgi:hypothetical protein
MFIPESRSIVSEYPAPYPQSIYEVADRGIPTFRLECWQRYDGSLSSEERATSILRTNMLIRLIQSEFVGPLTQIPDVRGRIYASQMLEDTDLTSKIDVVFDRVFSTNPPADIWNFISVEEERAEYRKRTVNILLSQYMPLSQDLVMYLRRRKGLSESDANTLLFDHIGINDTSSKKSIADSIGCMAMNEMRGNDLPAVKDEPFIQATARALKVSVINFLSQDVQPIIRRCIDTGRVKLVSQEEYETQIRDGAEVAGAFCSEFAAALKAFDEQEKEKAKAAASSQPKPGASRGGNGCKGQCLMQ